MNLTYNDRALVLRRSICNEYDKRVVLYTLGHGLIDATAIGAARITSKLGQHLEPLREISVMIAPGRRGAGGFKIAQAVTLDVFVDGKWGQCTGARIDACAQSARAIQKFCVRAAADETVYNLVRAGWGRIAAAPTLIDNDRECGALLYALLQHWGVAPVFEVQEGGGDVTSVRVEELKNMVRTC